MGTDTDTKRAQSDPKVTKMNFPAKKNILAVSQSKIEPKLGNLAWAGIGPKLSHFGHGYKDTKRAQSDPKVSKMNFPPKKTPN